MKKFIVLTLTVVAVLGITLLGLGLSVAVVLGFASTQTCLSLGYDAGALSCNVGCSYNTGTCESFSCGDNKCQAGEDSCVCPEDCPEDPNTCSACECGGQGGPDCFCDIFCVLNFDCCFGGPC